MKKVLFTWLGMTDIRCAKESNDGNVGPIAMAVLDRHYDVVYILSNSSVSESSVYKSWLQRQTDSKIEIVLAKLSGPTEYGEIFEVANNFLDSLKIQDGKHHLTFHLSPGTPAMSSVWIMLSKSLFPAELIDSSIQKGVRTVSFPFDLYVDYLVSDTTTSDALKSFEQSGKVDFVPFKAIKFKSDAMKLLIARTDRVAKFDVPVLIDGESGTGKELFATAIHQASKRKSKPFIAVNCGAIPPELFESEFFGYVKGAFTGATKDKVGYIEAATGGTLFLDEIGEMPLTMQVKLLRTLQQGSIKRVGDTEDTHIDFRIIAATNRNLLQEVVQGNFREDLFHRLAVGVINIPPLRERREDLSMLMDFFIGNLNNQYNNHKKLSVSARNIMLRCNWPGNVRELQNTIQRLFVWSLSDTITDKDVRDNMFTIDTKSNKEDSLLNLSVGGGFKLESVVQEVEKLYIEKALAESHGNKSKASQLLGLKNYQTLNNKIKKYGMG